MPKTAPHVHLSAVHALAALLFIFAVFGTAHLWAMSHPNSKVSQTLVVGLGF